MLRKTYVVSTEDSNDFAAAVELNKQSLVEVLRNVSLEMARWGDSDKPS